MCTSRPLDAEFMEKLGASSPVLRNYDMFDAILNHVVPEENV